MSQEIINEVYFLADSVVIGIIITFVYDFILIGRRVIKHSLFFVSLEDFVFWASCAVAVFYMLYEENNGIHGKRRRRGSIPPVGNGEDDTDSESRSRPPEQFWVA